MLPAGVGGTVATVIGSVMLWRSAAAPAPLAMGWTIGNGYEPKQYSRAAETNPVIKLWGKSIGDNAILIIDEN